MGYLSLRDLDRLGFKSVGKNVLISDKASFYDTYNITIGDYSRIDDYCVISGKVTIGKHVHIAVHNNIAGGTSGITIDDYVGIAYNCVIFAQSDDYSGRSMTNPTIPKKYTSVKRLPIHIKRHSILGTNTVVFPGVVIEEGGSFGAFSMVNKSTKPWMMYFGIPIKSMGPRSKNLLLLQEEFESLHEWILFKFL